MPPTSMARHPGRELIDFVMLSAGYGARCWFLRPDRIYMEAGVRITIDIADAGVVATNTWISVA